MERRFEQTFVRFFDRIHENPCIERKAPKGISVVQGEKSSNDYQTRSCVARSMDPNWESRSEERKKEWANEKPELDNARRMRGTHFIDPRQGLARRMAQSPAMLFKQTCHPHFSSLQRLRANCRAPGPLAPPVSPACLEDRPVRSAPDRPSCRSCRGTQTRTWF